MQEQEHIGKSERDFADRTKRFFGDDYEDLIAHPILVIGAGAVGNEVIKNLAMLGVQKISVVDFDYVSTSNLNRCVFFRPEDHDAVYKVDAIKRGIASIVPSVSIIPYTMPIQDAPENIWQTPLVIVAVDNNEARYYINMMCNSLSPSPFVINGAIGRTFFDVQVLKPKVTACMTCLWSESYWQKMFARLAREDCDAFFFRSVERFPAISIMSSLIGSIMAAEAIKILTGLTKWKTTQRWHDELIPALGKSIRYDIRNHESSCGKIYRNPKCGEIFCRKAYEKKE